MNTNNLIMTATLLLSATSSTAAEPKRDHSLPIRLEPVAAGFSNITDVRFLPNSNNEAVVLEKGGAAYTLDLKTQKKFKLVALDVATPSELGLLGIAFHPKFSANKRVFLHYNPSTSSSRVSEWTWKPNPTNPTEASLLKERVLLEVEQPYKNHNGGSLLFGADGYLYIGFGDGGNRADPQNRAQNLETLLGKMLRIDVDHHEGLLEYGIPKDNPFAKQLKSGKGPRREIFAWGLRNPWKYSFDDKDRLIAGDVGQDTWEEITFVPKGANLGWRVYEASHCFEPPKNCQGLASDTIPPIAEYGRELGSSVTGGFQYQGKAIPELKGRYVFGDFISGRIWSILLPSKSGESTLSPKDFQLHGKYDIAISSFARDSIGEIYVADFGGGRIYRLTK